MANAANGGAFVSSHSGGGIRTRDLRVMSPTSYQTAPPRNQGSKVYPAHGVMVNPWEPLFLHKAKAAVPPRGSPFFGARQPRRCSSNRFGVLGFQRFEIGPRRGGRGPGAEPEKFPEIGKRTGAAATGLLLASCVLGRDPDRQTAGSHDR